MPGYSKRQEVWQHLWDQLGKAREVHVTPVARFDLLVKAGPSLLPRPDGSLLMQKFNREAIAALLQCMQALKQFTDFDRHGTVPENLLPSK
jgi:hypothetical protein